MLVGFFNIKGLRTPIMPYIIVIFCTFHQEYDLYLR